ALADNAVPPSGPTDRRARRARSGVAGAADLLKAGPGILARALQSERTLTGFPINQDKVTRLSTLKDESRKRADLQKLTNKRANEMLVVMDRPFNQISVITEQLGLTGAWGIILERFAVF